MVVKEDVLISIWIFIVAICGFLGIMVHLYINNNYLEKSTDYMEGDLYSVLTALECYIEKYGEMSTAEMMASKCVQEKLKNGDITIVED